MRSKSPDLMDKILKYSEEYYLERGYSPSTETVAKALNVAKLTVYRYLVEMNEKGMIEYDGSDIRSTVTRKANNDVSQTAIVGSIPCGTPEYEEENIEGYVFLPTAIFGKGDFYILRASGESMIDAGIDNGDLVVIRQKQKAKDGDIVVALVDNQNTLISSDESLYHAP